MVSELDKLIKDLRLGLKWYVIGAVIGCIVIIIGFGWIITHPIQDQMKEVQLMDQDCHNCKHNKKTSFEEPCVDCVTYMRSTKWESIL